MKSAATALRRRVVYRAVVVVNGVEVGKQERESAIVVVPFGVGWDELGETLIAGGFDVRSEWIDGTGTLTATIQPKPLCGR